MSSLKPIVASLFCLGLVSGAALAASADSTQFDAMKANVSKMEAALNQNQAGSYTPPDWFNNTTINGQLNFDGYLANRAPTTMGNLAASGSTPSANDLVVNNASLFVDSRVNEWVNAHLHLLYGQNAPSFIRVSANSTAGAPPFGGVSSIFNEGYLTIGNFARSPFYFRAGREYVPFGDYNRYAMTNMVQSTTQLLSMTQATAAQVGFVDSSGFNGAAYLFRGDQPVGAASTRAQNFGLNLGFMSSYDNLGYKIGVGYLRSMADVMFINSTLNTLSTGFYNTRIGGVAANASVNSGPFDGAVSYVSALQTFSPADVAFVENGAIQGAKPAAWGIDLGYSFPTIGHVSRFGLGYQGSSQANLVGDATGDATGAAVGLPKNRYLANYVVNLSKCTDLGLEVYNDRAYSNTQGGTGNNATTGVVRLGVRFS